MKKKGHQREGGSRDHSSEGVLSQCWGGWRVDCAVPTGRFSDGFSLLLYDPLISELHFRESPTLLFIFSKN